MAARSANHVGIEHLGELLVIRFTGPKIVLNDETVPTIATELLALADAFAGSAFLIDLVNVPFVSTPGLTLLLQFRKRVQSAGGQVRLANFQPRIEEVFRVTGLDKVFNLEAPEWSAA
jgi:anti-sigma B factor antagonist